MRKPKPFFRKFTGTWYVQLGKRQINLGPEEEAAWNQYHQLMLGQGDLGDSEAVAVLIDLFLDWCKRNRAPASYDFYFRFLNSFAQAIGRRLQARQLKPFHVTHKLNITGLCAYVLRHTFATHSLINGVDAQTVAELMGHADTTMLSRVYQHLRGNPNYLAGAADRATTNPNC